MQDPTVLPIAERERRVWDAAEKYMSGKSSAEEFEETERRYTPDLKAAALKLAENWKFPFPDKQPKGYVGLIMIVRSLFM